MPNTATFSSMIKGLFRRIKLVRLSDCLRKWVCLVVGQMWFTYGVLINGLCRTGNKCRCEVS